MRRSGSADLPLHNGYVPAWLAERMAKRKEKDFVAEDRLEEVIAKEWQESPKYGRRTVQL